MSDPTVTSLLAGEHVDTERAAVVDAVGPVTWRELADRVHRLAGHFRSLGLPPGAPVLVVSTNRREIVELTLACHQGGWEYVPANWHFTATQMGQVLTDLDARVVVVDAALVGLLLAGLGERGVGSLLEALVLDDGSGGDDRPDGFGSYELAIEAADPDPAPGASPGGVVFYTSGTTGRARGVRFLAPDGVPDPVLRRASSTVEAAGLPPGGRTLMCGPHYHWAQWVFGMAPLLHGSTLVMHQRFVPANVLWTIDERRITNTLLVPTQFVRLLRVDAPTRQAFTGESLRTVVHGAAPCAPETKRSMIDWWGPVFVEYYGATEGGVVSLIDTAEWLQRPGSVGRPLPWIDVAVIADDGTPAGPDRDGVVHVGDRDGFDIEFVDAPAVTTAVHARPGFVTFSDIGRIDADGYLFLSDRTTDMIVSGGTNVSSGTVEGVLAGHPAVADVAVFGVPDPSSGQAIVAALQLVAGRTWGPELEAEIAAYCAERLASHQRPVRYEVAGELPRNPCGKLMKRRLRAEHWGYPVD